MSEEKKIAQAILDAQKMHEDSYVVDKFWGDGSGEISHHELEIEECLIATCKKHGLSPNLWYLLSLAMHFWNDVQIWANDVLAGKNISDEIEKGR